MPLARQSVNDAKNNQDPNQTEIFNRFLTAAENGSVEAQRRVAEMYAFGDGTEKDLQKAYFWLSKLAEKGDDVAQSNLAWMYYRGEGVEADKTIAFEWFLLAARNGNQNAQTQSGQHVLSRRGGGQR